MKQKTLIIADPHGRYDKLLKALEYAEYRDRDRLIFLGDYIDRGSDSKKVMDFMLELKKNKDNIFLMGNHEFMILSMLTGLSGYVGAWLEDGEGRLCIRSYGFNPNFLQWRGVFCFWKERDEEGRFIREIPLVNGRVQEFIKMVFPKEHLEFMTNLKDRYETNNFFFSHAGVTPNIPLSEQKWQDLLWGYDKFYLDRNDYGRVIVYGHWHRGLQVGFKKVSIAAKNGAVGVLNLNEMVYVDSDGNTAEVKPEQLMGGQHNDYMLMPGKL
ncbi:MAG: metallophosphoesterase [Nitrospiraceae bacterium]|nr:metallophosphoesterase [Nitrospiraceae bacterium]